MPPRSTAVRIYAFLIAVSGVVLSALAIALAFLVPSLTHFFSHPPTPATSSSTASAIRTTPSSVRRPKKLVHSASRKAFSRLPTRSLRRKHHVSLSLSITLPPGLCAFRRQSRCLALSSPLTDSTSNSPFPSRASSPIPTPSLDDSASSIIQDDDDSCSSSIRPPRRRFHRLSSPFKLHRFATIAAATGNNGSKPSLVKSFTTTSSKPSSLSSRRRITLPAVVSRSAATAARWNRVNAIMSAVESSLPTYWPKSNVCHSSSPTTSEIPLPSPLKRPMDRHATMDSFTWGLLDIVDHNRSSP